MNAYGVRRQLAEPRVPGLHSHRLAVQQLTAQPLELHARALEFGAGPGPPQSRFGGDLSGAAPQHPVPEQAVDGGAGLGDGGRDTWQVEQGT